MDCTMGLDLCLGPVVLTGSDVEQVLFAGK